MVSIRNQQSSISNFFLWLGLSANPASWTLRGRNASSTEGLWVKCENCRQIIWKKDLEENMNVCPKCDKHFRIDARTRLAQLLDDNQYETFDGDIASTDPLKFVDLKPYSVPAETGAGGYGPERRSDQCARQADGTAGGGQCDGVCLHRRQHGRGGRRGDYTGRGTCRRNRVRR